MRNYEDVVSLLRDSLNGYAYESLDKADAKRFDKAYQAGDEEVFCNLFGPEHILDHLGEFLGYFMVRRVMGSQELLRSSGTVTKKLVAWLYEHGYVSDDEREIAIERATEAARDLPRAERLASLLYDQSRATPNFDSGALGKGDLVEDYLMIERIEPAALYFGGGISPLGVSEQASKLAEVGWGGSISRSHGSREPGSSSRSATSTRCSDLDRFPCRRDNRAGRRTPSSRMLTLQSTGSLVVYH